MNKRRLLKRLSQGALHNVAFNDMIGLVEGFGFNLLRVAGSHHVFGHPGISELVNLQEVKGQTKPYQIRQFLRLIERYNLKLEDE
ncbi:MAG TPA: type II toxin-antitoxin system HicA family toxin [Candidatus Binatia bacterium]|jgi:predicted RNA binding protein YcfA (HicA-like mRNA interferase family)